LIVVFSIDFSWAVMLVRLGKFCLHPLQVHLKLSDMSSLSATSSVFYILVQSIQ
jgi:hypothetical protein